MLTFILAAFAILAITVLIGSWLKFRAEQNAPPHPGILFDPPRSPRRKEHDGGRAA